MSARLYIQSKNREHKVLCCDLVPRVRGLPAKGHCLNFMSLNSHFIVLKVLFYFI